MKGGMHAFSIIDVAFKVCYHGLGGPNLVALSDPPTVGEFALGKQLL